MIKLIVADDQVMFRECLVSFLEEDEDFKILGHVSNGQEVLELLLKETPDVIITDVEMPEMDGIELTKEIKSTYPDLPVIGITMYEEEDMLADMFRAGAKGYVLKRSSRQLVKDAIRVVLSKGYYFCNPASEKLLNLIPKHKEVKTQELTNLTETEIKIINLTCQGLSHPEIGETLHLGRRTVENYRQTIYQKTGARNAVELAIFAVKIGLFNP